MQSNNSQNKVVNKTADLLSVDSSKENNITCNRGDKRPHEDNVSSVTLPNELKKMFKPLTCELCDVSVSSPLVALTHYQGKSHLKHVNNYMQTKFNITNAIKKRKEQFEPLKCDVCNLELNSEIVYKQHIVGKQHMKNMKRSKPVIPQINVEVDLSGRFGIGKAFLDENNQLTQVSSVNTVHCETCHVSTHTEEEMSVHKNGKKHRKKIAAKEY